MMEVVASASTANTYTYSEASGYTYSVANALTPMTRVHTRLCVVDAVVRLCIIEDG